VYNKIEVIEVLNQKDELLSFPVEGTINILFSGKPNPKDIADYVYYVRHDGDMDVNLPGTADNAIREVGYVQVDRYDRLETRIEFSTGDPDEWILSITPAEAMISNAAYYLVLSKFLSPEYYEVVKSVTFGPSTIEIGTEPEANSETANFEILITNDSELSTGSHYIEFDISKDGLPSTHVRLDIANEKYYVFTGVEIIFDKDTPYISGESFTIDMLEFSNLEETLIQYLETTIHPKIIQPSEEIQSERLDNSQIVEFYEENGWTERVYDDGEISNNPDGSIIAEHSFDFIHPATIIINCGAEIDPSTLTDSIFNIEINYAFNNYILPEMGYYNEDIVYKIFYSIEKGQFLKLETVVYDGVLPEGEKFILEQRV